MPYYQTCDIPAKAEDAKATYLNVNQSFVFSSTNFSLLLVGNVVSSHQVSNADVVHFGCKMNWSDSDSTHPV